MTSRKWEGSSRSSYSTPCIVFGTVGFNVSGVRGFSGLSAVLRFSSILNHNVIAGASMK